MSSGLDVQQLVHRVLRSTAARWIGLAALSWLMLRPALLVTISLDDFINPFSVFRKYGASPLAMLPEVNRDVLRNGHFNFLGQTLGAVVFRVYTHVVSAGVRYSFVYAVTKFAVFLLTAVVAARLLRTLAALGGRTIRVWRSRLLVVLVLFATLQLHVAWSLDPVGSFPLSGYLSVAVGLWALDLAVRALPRRDTRSLVVAATALCVSILYYEINVAMVIALVPVVIVHLRRAPVRPVLVRTAAIVVPATVMTLVLQVVAADANRGYTGTDVDVAQNTPAVLIRTIANSLPASAWSAARTWLGRPFSVSVAVILSMSVVVLVTALTALGHRAAPAARDRVGLLLVVLSPLLVWLVATLVQAATLKVRVEAIRLGYVYNYYAYGSVGIALAAILAVPLLPQRHVLHRARPLLIALAVTFVVAQAVINDSVHRRFGELLVANRDVLAAYSDEAPPPQRCAALATWQALPFWPAYYRTELVEGMNEGYLHFHGEPFCATASA